MCQLKKQCIVGHMKSKQTNKEILYTRFFSLVLALSYLNSEQGTAHS
jgi:hypothetical protein